MKYRYNINQTIDSLFAFDLSKHQILKDSILDLKKNPSLKKINSIKLLISNLPFNIKHHIEIRLELIEDILNNPSSNIISI